MFLNFIFLCLQNIVSGRQENIILPNSSHPHPTIQPSKNRNRDPLTITSLSREDLLEPTLAPLVCFTGTLILSCFSRTLPTSPTLAVAGLFEDYEEEEEVVVTTRQPPASTPGFTPCEVTHILS